MLFLLVFIKRMIKHAGHVRSVLTSEILNIDT